MPIVVERSFEPPGDVVTGTVPNRRHRHGRGHAPASRTADEEEVVVRRNAKGLQLGRQTLRETRIHALIGKRLPLDEHSPLPEGFQVRNPDIGPLSPCPHINQLRTPFRRQFLPCLADIDVVDGSIAVLRAQGTRSPSLQTKRNTVCLRPATIIKVGHRLKSPVQQPGRTPSLQLARHTLV
jgi:hypothetical protein